MNKCAHEIFTNQQDWKFIAYEDHLAIVAELESRIEKLTDAIKKCENFLNTDIAMLPCESRQRDLPEDVWEFAMYHRDLLGKALKQDG